MDAFKQFLNQFHLNMIQWAALILGVAEVLLARANNIWLYPTGIAAIVLSIYSLFTVQLYAECVLNLYYLAMSIYGWMYWSSKNEATPVEVTRANKNELRITGGIVLISWLLLYVLLTSFTSSNVPLWDAWVSATGWAGMWLLARRKVENWILLNISNAFAIPLLFSKGLPLFGLLTVFLFLVACKGYFDWAKIVRQRNPIP